jgi:hypothetical protein
VQKETTHALLALRPSTRPYCEQIQPYRSTSPSHSPQKYQTEVLGKKAKIHRQKFFTLGAASGIFG